METNRPYISHSQYALFNSSPKAYYEKYVLAKDNPGTRYQKFGKKLMEDLEFNEIKGIPKDLKDIVANGLVEFEIECESKFIKKDLFGIIDVVDNDKKLFVEIKTGKIPWDEARVKKDTQMLFYATMINLKYGIIPRASLVWAETMDDGEGGIVFTGKVKAFRRNFTLRELADFTREIALTVEKIEEYEHEIVEVEVDRDAKLLELMTEKKRIDAELDLLKAEIMLDIKEFNNKYAQSENFNITLAKRTTYTYSKELTERLKRQTVLNKKRKLIEEKNGVATPKVTEYLLIKTKK